MHTFYKLFAIWICFTSISLMGEPLYFFCIEGGGSKTLLQVINRKGEIVSLVKEGVKSDRIETAGSNINVIGEEGVRDVLKALFENVFLIEEGREREPITCIFDSQIVAGMSGASLPQNEEILFYLLEEKGFRSNHIIVKSDAEISLELVEGEGIILIAGTGSICFGKREVSLFRVGGLGRILGDEGSGYQIGLQALKAVLAEEYGWGMSTRLTPVLKEFFQVTDFKTLIPKVNQGEISPSVIASIAPFVFRHAWEHDEVAEKIINQSASDLSFLLTSMVEKMGHFKGEVHLWGGIFKNHDSAAFIQKMREKLPESYRNIKIINRANDNPAVLYAIQKFAQDI